MARNREREAFVKGIKVGDVVTFCGVQYEVTGIPPAHSDMPELGPSTNAIFVKPVDPTKPLRLIRGDCGAADGGDW